MRSNELFPKISFSENFSNFFIFFLDKSMGISVFQANNVKNEFKMNENQQKS